MMKKIGNIVRIALVIVVIALIFMNLKNGFETNINYSEMVSAIKQEKVIRKNFLEKCDHCDRTRRINICR